MDLSSSKSGPVRNAELFRLYLSQVNQHSLYPQPAYLGGQYPPWLIPYYVHVYLVISYKIKYGDIIINNTVSNKDVQRCLRAAGANNEGYEF